MDDAIPFVEIAAAQELLGGAASELERVRRTRRGGGLEVHARGIVTTSSRSERVTQLHLQIAAGGRRRCRHGEGAAVEVGSPIEGERVAGAIARQAGVLRGAIALAGALEMHEQRFR